MRAKFVSDFLFEFRKDVDIKTALDIGEVRKWKKFKEENYNDPYASYVDLIKRAMKSVNNDLKKIGRK